MFKVNWKNYKIYWEYLLLFIIYLFLTYGIHVMFGYSLISTHDVLHQHLPIFIKYQHILASWIHHTGFGIDQWSWQLGLGASVFKTFSYYVIGDPFAYLSLFFNKNHLIFAFQLIEILRVFFAGYSFVFLAKRFNVKNSAILIGSIAYISSGFAIYSSLFQPFFINALILFPLLIVGIDNIFKNKSSVFFGIIVYFALTVNFYLAFLLGIGCLVYVILYYWNLRKVIWKQIGKLILSFVVATLMSSWILLPELISMINSPRLINVPFANNMHVYTIKYYFALFDGLFGNVNIDPFWLNTLSVNFLLIVLIWLFKNRKKYKLLTQIFVIGLVCSIFPLFAAMFNGFTSPSNRWMFLLTLPLCIASVFFFDQLNLMSLNDWHGIIKVLLIFVVVLLFISLVIFNEGKVIIPQLIFLFLYTVIFVLGTKNKKLLFTKILLPLILFNVFISFNFENDERDIHQFVPLGSVKELIFNPYGFANINHQSKDWYRTSNISNYVSTSGGIVTNNFLFNSPNIDSFYSIQNSGLLSFSKDLLNSQEQLNLPIQQFDDRARVLNFLGVKYLYTNSGLNNVSIDKLPHGYESYYQNNFDYVPVIYGTNGNVQLYRSKQNYPLLYLQHNVMSNLKYNLLTPNEKELSLAQTAAIKNTKGLHTVKFKNSLINIPYKIYDDKGNKVSDVLNSQKATNYNVYIPNNKKYKNLELHLLFNNVFYNVPSLQEQIQMNNLNSLGINGSISNNKNQTSVHGSWDNFRKNVTNNFPTNRWTIALTSGNRNGILTQVSNLNMSEYEDIHNGIINLGWFKHLPNNINMLLQHIGKYSFNLKIVGLPMGHDYNDQVKKIQRNAVKHIKINNKEIVGEIKARTNGVIASSIPYDSGWKIKLNDKKVKPIKVDNAFIGFKISKPGHYKISMIYHTPGLKLGIFTSLITFIALIFSRFLMFILNKKEEK